MEQAIGILIIVAVVGFVGFKVWQDKKNQNVKVPAPTPAPKKKAGGGRPRKSGNTQKK